LRGRDHLGDSGVDGRIIMGSGMWGHDLGRYGQVSSTCECGNEHSSSVNCGELFD
jgi:hypothetical protein